MLNRLLPNGPTARVLAMLLVALATAACGQPDGSAALPSANDSAAVASAPTAEPTAAVAATDVPPLATTVVALPIVEENASAERTPTVPATATTVSNQVPQAAQCYFDAVNAEQIDTTVACFTADAVIIDVGRQIVGHDAIRRWANNEVIGGRYTIFESVPQGASFRLLVEFAPPGSSSGFRAYYTLDIRDGLISRADLQYA